MADYHSLLSRAVANLSSKSSPATRQAIYDRARKALLTQLRTLRPPLPESDIAREERALDAAIEQVETRFVAPDEPAVSTSPQHAPTGPAGAPRAARPSRRFAARTAKASTAGCARPVRTAGSQPGRSSVGGDPIECAARTVDPLPQAICGRDDATFAHRVGAHASPASRGASGRRRPLSRPLRSPVRPRSASGKSRRPPNRRPARRRPGRSADRRPALRPRVGR